MQEKTLGQSRVAAFSDGVFAVAITLLVLNLQVRGGARPEPLHELLRAELPNYVVFVVSFAMVGIKWLNHHRMFERIRRVDTTLVLLNLLLLLAVTVVPFTTALLGSYLRTPDAAPAAMLYGLVWMVNGMAYTLVWAYASRRGYTAPEADTVAARRTLVLYALGPVGYAVGAALSFVNAYAAIALYCIVISAYVAPPPHLRRHAHALGRKPAHL